MTRTTPSCQAVAATYDLLQLLTYIIWAGRSRTLILAVRRVEHITWTVMAAIRIYVVGKGNLYLSVFVFCLAIVPFATTMYASVMVTYAAVEFPPSLPFCDPTAHFSMTYDNR
ncbi:uncharacterized protein B0H18DRAFT_393403 [Fomitopsis serialis]|uniref:uncharacterized protein n=1 Tax=Fomitopsis serialis TaxID=139415 RepID=UPI002007B788|nr:uncharacterized protein B0H18DRAFT_393403 [Neoantrodia serialis]KAH9924844.1 hypothetical protein B0H18DRAFT_393403 [Neoantrodia serialis]